MNKKAKEILFVLLSLIVTYIALTSCTKLPTIEIINSNNHPKIFALTELVLVIPFLIYGFSFMINGFKELLHKRFTSNMLITIGLLTSFIYSLVNTILIFKGHTCLTSNVYFYVTALLVAINKANYDNETDYTKTPSSEVSKKYFLATVLVSIATLVAYLEIGNKVSESFNHLFIVAIASISCTIALAKSIVIKRVTKNYLISSLNITNNHFFEYAKKIDKMVLDIKLDSSKKYILAEVNNYSSYTDEELLDILSSIEANSNHPYAKAFSFIKNTHTVKNYKEIDDIGISGKITKSIIYIGNEKLLKKQKITNKYKKYAAELSNNGNHVFYVIEKKKIISVFGIREEENVEKIEGLEELKNSHYQIITKDQIKNNEITMIVKKELNKPIEVYINSNNTTNSTPDVIINDNTLSSLKHLLRKCKKIGRIINQNLFLSIFFNLCITIIATGALFKLKLNINHLYIVGSALVSSALITINSLRVSRK